MAPAPTLVIIRGNSGSGKTSTAREVQRRYGRGCALVEQDHLRRMVLREHDSFHIDPVAPAFITATVGAALTVGYHVVLEGILHTERYATVLRRLIDGHPGPCHVFYFDLSFAETVRRHQTRPEPIDVTAEQMRDWYAGRDLLGVADEHVLDETVSFEAAVETILDVSGLTGREPLTPCPVRCRRCAAEATTGRLSERPA